MPIIQRIRAFIVPISATLALLVVGLLYWPGTSGALYYDDYNALNSLAALNTPGDSWNFVMGGTAGPLGRPIALASYLPHAEGWPESRRAILQVNVLIHLINAFLLGLMAWMMLRLRGVCKVRAYWIALGAATLWSVLPIIVSASLIAIQRMTTLAALFGLLGLVGFIAGYWLRSARPYMAFILQFGSLGAGTVLGLFTKESAALIPIFALLLDTLLLRHRTFPNRLQTVSRFLLFGSLAALLFYLSPIRFDWLATYEHRGWSPWERLQYQIAILWEYLRLTVAPLPTAFGPFQDHRGITDIQPMQSILAGIGWLSLLAGCMWLWYKRGNPWPLFALLWFFTGHLLESTVLSLELVFEHRNYLAVFGLTLALAIGTANAPDNLRRIAPVLFFVFLAIQAAALFAMASLWGQPRLAAEYWTERYPNSARAAMHAAFIEVGGNDQLIADLNQGRLTYERRRRAIEILDRTAANCPDCADVRMQALLHACLISSESEIRNRFDQLSSVLTGNGKINISVSDGFFPLQELAAQKSCTGIEQNDVVELIDQIASRQQPIRPMHLARMLFVAAKAQTEIGDWHGALETLMRAEHTAPYALPILQFQVYIHLHLDEPAAAAAAIERRRSLDRTDSAMTDTILHALEQQVHQHDAGI